MSGEKKGECVRRARRVIEDLADDKETIERGVTVRLDYVEMNDADSFAIIADGEVMGNTSEGSEKEPVILSGAIWVGRTRLIDNIVMGDVSKILG